MAPYESSQGTEEAEERPVGRRKAARYAVPVAVAGVAAATIGLVPALADSGDPDLPKITAQELIEKIAASDVEQFSGRATVSTDLGLPDFGGMADSFAPKGGEGKGGGAASPDAKLLELASGTHTLKVAADGPDKQKLSLLDDAGEYSVIRNGAETWAFDGASKEALHSTDGHAGERGEAREHGKLPQGAPTTPKELAEQALKAADKTTSVTVGGTASVAGRDAYQLVIQPKGENGAASKSTVESIRIAVDAEKGVPLKFTLTPKGGGKPVVDAGFTQVDFAKPAASTFDFAPPKGTKVTEADELEQRGPGDRPSKGDRKKGDWQRGDWKKGDWQKGDWKKGHPFDQGAKGAKDGKGPEGLNVIGEGWDSIAVLDGGAKGGLPTGGGKGSGSGDVPAEASQFLDALGDKVNGKFGSGTVFSTRLINALMTDDGKVYVGAVTKEALVDAANAAAK